MSSLPPPTAPPFFRPTSDLARLTIVTDVHWWHGHYDHKSGVPHRCGGSICSYCDAGRQPELRFVLGCYHGGKGRVLIELRERHRAVLEQILAQPEGIVGTVIDIYKKGEAKNSPVEVEMRSRSHAEPWDIRLLVESLGTRQLNP